MTLRDELGEVEVGIGDLFEIKGATCTATFSVICPESIYSAKSPIWVRLMGGWIESDGKRLEVREDGNEALRFPVLLFTAELVARCIREHRLMTFDIREPVGQHPARIENKSPRARPSKKDAGKSQPITDSLFD